MSIAKVGKIPYADYVYLRSIRCGLPSLSDRDRGHQLVLAERNFQFAAERRRVSMD